MIFVDDDDDDMDDKNDTSDYNAWPLCEEK